MKAAARPASPLAPTSTPAPLGAVVAEFVSLETLREAAPALAALCARAAPNPFAEPGFLLPLLDYERPRRLRLVVARDGTRWLGFVALIAPPLGLAHVWMSAYAALPAMAWDRDATEAALTAVLRLLREDTRLAGIVWPFVEPDSAFAAALQATEAPLALAGTRRRAALRLSGAADFDASLDPARAKKWARKAKKLKGKLAALAGPEGIDAFLAVERRGWKGARGTALADDARRLAFARAALDAFAREGRLDALMLRLDGAPVAAGLVLLAGDRAFYWKTAYDEAFAEASPGIQLTLAHSRRLADTPGLSLADSCAVEDHPMISRVWGETLTFEDWALGLTGERALRVWLAAARAKAWTAEAAKRWVKRALGRRLS